MENEERPSRLFQPWVWVLALVLLCAWMVWASYSSNLTNRVNLTNFYYNNAEVYQVASDKTASYLSSEQFVGQSQLVAGSIEKQQLANIVSQRMAEWRDQVVAYNEGLATYQMWQSYPIVGILYPPLPTDVKFLSIK